MSVQIEIDKASQRRLMKQFAILEKDVERSAFSAIFKVLMKIKTEAQLRLTARKHIVTSRLKNSIYVKTKEHVELPTSSGRDGGNSRTYSDSDGQTYMSDLRSVKVRDLEGAVGTNVIYGNKIEVKDSYLYWAMKNVNITRSVGDDLGQIAKGFKTGSKTGKFFR